MVVLVLKILFHALPLISLFFQKYYLTLAFVLLVFLPYIKCKKISQEIEQTEDEAHKVKLNVSLNRFKKLTFWD